MNSLKPRGPANNLVSAFKHGLTQKPMHFTMLGLGMASCFLFGGFFFFCGAVTIGATAGPVLGAILNYYNAKF
jgi:hypothetical protein